MSHLATLRSGFFFGAGGNSEIGSSIKRGLFCFMRDREWKSRLHAVALCRDLTEAENKLWQDVRGRRVEGQ